MGILLDFPPVISKNLSAQFGYYDEYGKKSAQDHKAQLSWGMESRRDEKQSLTIQNGILVINDTGTKNFKPYTPQPLYNIIVGVHRINGVS